MFDDTYIDYRWIFPIKFGASPGDGSDTVGKKWVRAANSVDANISEGFGRFTAKDSKNFYIIARGSMQESKTWLVKAFRRNLISANEYEQLSKEWDTINYKLINFIKAHSKLMTNK